MGVPLRSNYEETKERTPFAAAMAAITPHAQNLRSNTNEEEEEEKSHASPVQAHEYVALNFTGHAHRAPA